MNKNILIAVFVVTTVLFAVLYWTKPMQFGMTTTEYNVKEFANTVTFTGATAFTGAQTLTGETTLSNCTSQTWNPGAAGSTTVNHVDVTMPTGYALGDLLSVGIATGTQGLGLGVRPSGTKANVYLFEPDGNAQADIDIATTTIKTCYFD